MRRVLIAAIAMTAAAHGAQAADMPEFGALRGAMVDTPRGVVDWQGFYVGGQAGYGASDMDFTNSTQGAVANLLTNTVIENTMGVSSWPVLGKSSSRGQGWGGFVGYNAQWDDVVLGIEANYMHGSFGGSTSGYMGRIFSTGGVTYDVDYNSAASIKVNDVGSARLRAGWVIGSFLPYAFGGVALGQADIIRTATISGTQGGAAFTPLTSSQIQNSHFIYGYSAGLGVDMMLYRGLFMRAEWEYQKFAAPINTSVSTVRAGVGYKF
ncbi:outer membrane beta-barrel protein [Rhodopseudomonas palustris]|uniref:outer membrane protein n=1 Tax=Rhodopseudomonas palustris TaxID=1076 RepID=UPI002ACE98BD|nr:outer membrane beta-barrel protein [Rhodopseudomonas palustris]WQG99582.1 outer membrane beta-barrel protein [Rhodopseudomonas palustris]